MRHPATLENQVIEPALHLLIQGPFVGNRFAAVVEEVFHDAMMMDHLSFEIGRRPLRISSKDHHTQPNGSGEFDVKRPESFAFKGFCDHGVVHTSTEE